MNHNPGNSMQSTWQGQRSEGITMSVEEIRRRAGKLGRKVFWRNFREYIGALIGIPLFFSFLVKNHDPLFRLAFGLFIAGMLWIVVQLYRKGTARSLPDAVDTSAGLNFYRSELKRQHEVLRHVLPWYLAPLIPGFLVYTLAYVLAFPHPRGWVSVGLLDLVVAGLFYAIWKFNLRAAKCLQRMIDELQGE